MGAAVISLVSGGSRGLGLAIVESLLARGDRVATFSRSGSDALVGLAAGHADRLHVEQLDAAAVIFKNLGHDGQAETRAFCAGRHIGLQQALAVLGGVAQCLHPLLEGLRDPWRAGGG